jgi:hypothetical protein
METDNESIESPSSPVWPGEEEINDLKYPTNGKKSNVKSRRPRTGSVTHRRAKRPRFIKMEIPFPPNPIAPQSACRSPYDGIFGNTATLEW